MREAYVVLKESYFVIKNDLLCTDRDLCCFERDMHKQARIANTLCNERENINRLGSQRWKRLDLY